MKRPAIIVVWVTSILFFNSPLLSQTFEDFKKQIREEYSTFEKETQQKFDDFVVQIDIDFSNYLTDGFSSQTIEKGEVQTLSPKPDNIPEFEEVVITGNSLDYEVGNYAITYQGPAYPGIKKTEDIDFEIQKIDVDFLGWPLYFNLDSRFSAVKETQPSPENASKLWTEFAELNYNHFLYQVSEVANTLNLNNWAYYQLIKECSQQIYPSSPNLQIAFQWTMLNRSRYKAKVGFNDKELFLLLPSIYNMYNIDFVILNSTKYYIIDGDGNEIQTYQDDFPEADIIMDVSINRPFNTNPIKKSRDYHFTYEGVKHTLKLDYDEEMIRFYKTIPLSEIIVYFNSVVCERTKTSVKKAFEPLLDGKGDIESANLLLSFTQQAFGYKTDQYAYGTERYFFADEVLHYQFSDCEDRSVLFSYLVKTLINKEVVAVGFPGHMATAIDFSDNPTGDYFNYKNRNFTISDPTFFGAPVGIVMPTVKDERATIYDVDNNTSLNKASEQIWSITNNYGGFKSDRLSDVITDNQGNYYVCGYFIDKADFGGNKISSEYDGRDVFIAKYDKDLRIVWIKSATGEGNDIGLSLCFDGNNTIYLYGSFENDLHFLDTEITATGAPDVFIASYSLDGNLNWVKKAGIDKLDHDLDFMFVAIFNPSGEKIMAKLYSQSEDFNHYGLEIDQARNAVIKGSFFATSGMNNNDFTNYDFGSELNIPVTLHETDIKLKQNEYEATIAGLFSALNLLKANTIEIQGSEIKSTFDTYNSNFSDYASGIYENLTSMKFVKNDKGIITIKTSQEKPIILDKIKIGNDARIRIVRYKSGNILVEVLSGIYVGGGKHWLDMNSIKLFKDSGDLLFNFDIDNSVKKINLKTELLKKS